MMPYDPIIPSLEVGKGNPMSFCRKVTAVVAIAVVWTGLAAAQAAGK